MNFRLLDSGWDRIFDESLQADSSRVRIVCPFIKRRAAERLFQHGQPQSIQVITRFNLDCFREGVSDVAAMRYLLERGAQIRGIKNLHAKAYLIGKSRVVVTSANLTEQALVRNHEFGFYAEDPAIAANCHSYFDRLWDQAKPDLDISKIEIWDSKLAAAKGTGSGASAGPSLGDDGVDVGFFQESGNPPTVTNSAEQGFVKFFGEGHRRELHSLPVLKEVKRAGCHWACTYPTTKRPRRVRDGAIMFMGRLVEHPNDTLIFGRGIGMAYVPGRDDASAADIRSRPWKKGRFTRYIRVHDTEFINGTLGDGVSLSEMMEILREDSFASTKRHLQRGYGNTNQRSAFNQQASVELTPEAIAWLNDRLEAAFEKWGKISGKQLAKLDWPSTSA